MNGRENAFQQAMKQGHSAAWDLNWELAAEHYQRALTESPKNAVALSSLGLALFELQRFSEAQRYYADAVAVSPDDPMPLEKLAQIGEQSGDRDQIVKFSLRAAEIYFNRGDVDRAIENLIRVIRFDPENLAAHTRLAFIYERLGRKPQAVTEYIAVASIMQHRGEIEKAVQAVNRALQILPDSEEARRAFEILKGSKPLPKPASSLGMTGRIKLPVEVARSEQKVSPPANVSLDPIEEARQKSLADLASLIFETSGTEQPEIKPSSGRGLQAIMRGIPVSQVVKHIDREKILHHLNHAVDLQTRGSDEEAVRELERAIGAGLDSPAASFDIGMIRFHEGRLESAIRHLHSAAADADFGLAAHLLIGQALQRMGRVDETAVEYLHALKYADSQVVPKERADELQQLYDPLIETFSREADAETRQQLSNKLEDLLLDRNWKQKISQARRDMPLDDEDGPPMPLGEVLTDARNRPIYESIATLHAYARAGYPRSAMEEAFHALQYAPTYVPLHMYMGELLIQQDRLPEAIQKFLVISQTHHARGDKKRSIQTLYRILRVAPMDLKARKRLIDLLLTQRQFNEVINQYLEMADVYYRLADLELARKTYSKALQLAQETKQDQDLVVQILRLIADIDLQSLDWRSALQHFEQICAIHPGDRSGLENLVELYIRLGQANRAEAELIKYLSSVTKTGMLDHAIPFLDRLAIENPEQAFLRKYIVETLINAGRQQEAVNELQSLYEGYVEAGYHQVAAQVIQDLVVLDPLNKSEYQTVLTQLRQM
jgi:tetratricopeptide (TPR) repeat protein